MCSQKNVDRIVVDPSLYLEESTPLMYAVENRTIPDAFKVFGGKLVSLRMSLEFIYY